MQGTILDILHILNIVTINLDLIFPLLCLGMPKSVAFCTPRKIKAKEK